MSDEIAQPTREHPCGLITGIGATLIAFPATFLLLQLPGVVLAASQQNLGARVVLGNVALAVAYASLIAVGREFTQRRPWSWTAAMLALVVLTAATVLTLVWSLLTPPENDHGMVYVAMGAVIMGAASTAALTALCRHGRRGCLDAGVSR